LTRAGAPARCGDALPPASDWLRLLRVAGGIALDAAACAVRSPRDGIPASADDVDAAWLTAALAERLPGARVDRLALLGGHAGTTARVRLALFGTAGGSGALPESVFVKTVARPFATRTFTTLFGLGATEVDFYAAFPDAFPIRIPRCFAARRAARGGRFVLVLEDLEAAGCRFSTTEQRPSAEEVRSVVTTLARLHAAFWGPERLAPHRNWLRAPEENPQRGLEWWLAARSNGPALRRFADCIPPGVRAAAHRVHASRARLEAHWATLPRTLIHGDPHAGNLFFDGHGGEVGFFDWQVAQCGSGLRDLSYFLINSVDTEMRRMHECEMIALYVDTLRKHGVDEVGVDAAWEAHRLFALYVWIAVSFTAAASRLQPRSVLAPAVRRTAAALEDLRSFDALDALQAG